MLVPLTLQTLGGPLRKNVQRVGLMFVTVSIKGTSCHRSCTLNFLKMSRASIPWFQILPSMAPHALLGIKSLVHLGHISVLLAQTGQVPILTGASCLGASLTSGALQGFQVWFLLVLWLTTAMTPVVTLQTATMTFPVTSAVPMTPMEPRATRYTRDNCECILHGSHLPADVYTLYPLGEPGKYANLTHISVYGTTCAAWDQMPSTPWAPYCPRDADWCRSEFNFCQLPFCYVSAECPRKIPTRIWHGVASGPAVNSSMAWMASHFSYDTCLSTPDCYSRPFDAACPFDWVHSGWSTQQRCPYSWSDVCQCTYQGRLLPPDLYMNFPLDFPGKYQHLPNIAAWLQEHRFF